MTNEYSKLKVEEMVQLLASQQEALEKQNEILSRIADAIEEQSLERNAFHTMLNNMGGKVSA